MRVYEDGSAELVRWGVISKKWVFLLFPAEEAPDAMDKIKNAIKNHFDPFPSTSKQIKKDKDMEM